MAFSAGGKDKLKAEINVTPLVDVVLVLLIIFMVITPMLTRGREVQLPIASSPDAKHETIDAIVVTVTADKQLWLENSKIKLDKLADEVKARWQNSPDQAVLIKADSTVTVKDLRPVFQRLKGVKVSQIAFAVLEKKGS